MTGSVLVAYGSRHGGTREIAEAIGRVLAEAGVDVEVCAAGDVEDVTPYGAVIVGGAVYLGQWHRDSIEFLERFEHELRERPTWLFSSGPTGGSPRSDAAVRRAAQSPSSVSPVPEVATRARWISARGHATFGGRVGDDMRGFLERSVPRGDWRDFDAVRRWARSVAGDLVEPATA